MGVKHYISTHPFEVENGTVLEELQIAYHTYGKLNSERNNVVWVCHALTANSDVFDWWPGLFGDKDLFNPEDHFIVCANILGSHYGSTNPLSVNPRTKEPYYLDFPAFTIRDIVKGNQLLADHLGIQEINVLIGGSLGGQQVLEWAVSKTIKINHLIPIATNARFSPWGIAFNESQRLAIEADPTFYERKINGGEKGLKAARSMALISYRTYKAYTTTQAETDDHKTDGYKASSYQIYQGDKLVKRFNSYSYYYLTKAMDSHHLGRNRESVEKALASITSKTLVIGIPSDILFPPEEQKYVANHIPHAVYHELESFFGHDGFLIETKKLSAYIQDFLELQPKKIAQQFDSI